MSVTVRKFVAGVLLVLAAGCAAPPGPVVMDAGDIEPSLDTADLAFVLDKAVTSDGLLILAALAKHCDRLDRQLRRMIVTGPRTTPKLLASAEHRLAYWYNARTAWSMKLAAMCHRPEDRQGGTLTDRQFPIDGRLMTLADIDAVLGGLDDWRVVVACPGVTLRRSRLPAKPFTAEDIRQRVSERFVDFIDDERRFVIDVRRRRILVPAVLWQFRERIIQTHRATYGARGANLTTALLPHVHGSAHRRLQDAVGYRNVSAQPSLLMALLPD